MASWVRVCDFLSHGHAGREVRGSNLSRGAIIRGIFHPTRQGLLPPNMPAVVNLFRISPPGEAVNYRPRASPSSDVAKPCKITAISAIIIIFYYYYSLNIDRPFLATHACTDSAKAQKYFPRTTDPFILFMKNISGQKPFKCPQCPVTFSTKSNRERHMVRKHGLDIHDPATRQMMDRPFKCHLCVFSSFSTAGNQL